MVPRVFHSADSGLCTDLSSASVCAPAASLFLWRGWVGGSLFFLCCTVTFRKAGLIINMQALTGTVGPMPQGLHVIPCSIPAPYAHLQLHPEPGRLPGKPVDVFVPKPEVPTNTAKALFVLLPVPVEGDQATLASLDGGPATSQSLHVTEELGRQAALVRPAYRQTCPCLIPAKPALGIPSSH